MKVLVPLDDSELSHSILPTVQGIHRGVPAAEVHLMTVIDPGSAHQATERPPSGDAPYSGGGRVVRRTPGPATIESRGQALERLEDHARDALQQVASDFFAGAESLEIHIAWSDKPEDAIVELADSIDATMIAMATHGRSGLSHMIAGSVTEAVIRKTDRPVVVRRPKDA